MLVQCKMRLLQKVLAVLVFCVCWGSAARILGCFSTPSKSHLIFHMSVMKALLERGHEVTVITALPVSYEHPNLTAIHVKDKTLEEMHHTFSRQMLNQPKSVWANLKAIPQAVGNLFDFSNRTLNAPEVQALLKDPTANFDLLFFGYFFNEFYVGLADHFKCPTIVLWMNQPTHAVMRFVGNPQEISYVPDILTPDRQPMGFKGRLSNFIIGIVEVLLTNIFYYKNKSLYESNFPADQYRSFDAMLRNISLIFAAHHFSQGPIRASVPALVEIGGVQMKPSPDALSKKLEAFLDGASEHGAIFFSFGTNVATSELDSKMIDIIFNVFGSLKQSVVMKWEKSDIPVKANNIYFDKWLPQDDILAHPNVKLFITHGGLGSIVESKIRGIPIVGVPIFADQFNNVEKVRQEGWGLRVDYENITEQKLEDAIKEVLTNLTYKNNVRYHSSLYNDRLVGPKQTAIFWTEYVLRHRGAPHLQSPAVHMNSFAYYSLDVILFLGAFSYFIFKIMRLAFMRLYYVYVLGFSRVFFRYVSIEKLKK